VIGYPLIAPALNRQPWGSWGNRGPVRSPRAGPLHFSPVRTSPGLELTTSTLEPASPNTTSRQAFAIKQVKRAQKCRQLQDKLVGDQPLAPERREEREPDVLPDCRDARGRPVRTNFFQPVTYVIGICAPSRVKSECAKKKPRQGRAGSRSNKWGSCRASPRVEPLP